jgi:DNA mismatch repair protein MutL
MPAKSANCACRAGPGTRIEVRDLFYATPARLKFLKTDRAESLPSSPRRVKRLGMAHAGIAFTLQQDGRRASPADAQPGALARRTGPICPARSDSRP